MFGTRIVSCALQSIKQQQVLWFKHDESPSYMSCWIVEPLSVDQWLKTMCLGRDSIWQCRMPWRVFLTYHEFWWIVLHVRQVMLLMWWHLVVLKEECSCSDAKYVWLQQNPGAPGLFLPPSAKISRDEHWFPRNVYAHMIQSEYYIETRNQWGEIHRNRNEKEK
jgi:hypothetical protein